jgi:exodeoxyribonuclease VII large subunit
VLHNRCPVRVVVCPTPVQGSEAPAAIVQALRRADRLGVDLIIVGRGGGSLEDLWAFNTEGVARAIYSTKTPLISAIGHEVDVTIADLVADRRAPTPSGAAELAVPVMQDLHQKLALHRDRLVRAALHRHRQGSLSLERLRRRLGSPAHLVNRSQITLDETTGGLEAAISREIRAKHRLLRVLRSSLAAQEPRVRLGRSRTSLIAVRGRLVAAARHEVSRRRSALSRLEACLDNLSPLAVLDRGYALVLDAEGAVVREIGRLGRGDLLTLRLAGGEVRCSVTSVTPVPVGKPES